MSLLTELAASALVFRRQLFGDSLAASWRKYNFISSFCSGESVFIAARISAPCSSRKVKPSPGCGERYEETKKYLEETGDPQGVNRFSHFEEFMKKKSFEIDARGITVS